MFNVEQAQVLFALASGLADGARVLEIGPYKGYSTCALALACVGTGKHVWTIDTFRGNVLNTDLQDGDCYLLEFQQNIAARGLERLVTPLVGRSAAYYDWDTDIDMLFIDGNHALDVVTADLGAFYPRLKAGGVLAMHDVYPRGKEVAGAPNTWTPLLETLDGLAYLYNLAWGWKRA